MMPILEQRLDALGVPRQPRALVVPGLLLPPNLRAAELVPLVCPECGRADRWWFKPAGAVIICACRIRWAE